MLGYLDAPKQRNTSAAYEPKGVTPSRSVVALVEREVVEQELREEEAQAKRTRRRYEALRQELEIEEMQTRLDNLRRRRNVGATLATTDMLIIDLIRSLIVVAYVL